MCGILGYISKNKIEQNLFQNSLNTLSKRGPNAQGIFQALVNGKNIFLGHKRLAIIDLTESANQPMTSEDKNFVIVFNGEIYNYLDLKNDLLKKGCLFKTKSDTEVLLKGFIEYGQEIVQKIQGMFSFAILDKEKNELFFGRDHFGKKPLFYYFDNEVFVFASELKALLKFSFVKEKLNLDKQSLIKFLLVSYIPSPNSIFKEIKKIEPASIFQFDINQWKIKNKKAYWNLENIELNNKITEYEALEKFDFLLNQAVKKRLISDVPLGVFLSGGIDSSLVTALLAKNSNKINAFTVTYKNYQNDESFYAQKVSKHLGIKINIDYFENQEVQKAFGEILDYLDEPISDPATIPLYYISKKAKPFITVALSGDGGDEIFAGYLKYQAQIWVEKLKYFKFLSFLAEFFPAKYSALKKALKGIAFPFYSRQFIYGSGGFLPQEVQTLLNLDFLDLNEIFEQAQQYNELFKQRDVLNRSLYLDAKLQLSNWYLVKADQASSASSIEIRSPFLDKNLVEFAFSLKGSWKLKNLQTKYLLKKLAEKYLPKEIIYRKKMGFQLPLKQWLTNEFSYLTNLENLAKLGIFNQNAILNLKKDLVKNIPGAETKIWQLIVLNNFVKKCL